MATLNNPIVNTHHLSSDDHKPLSEMTRIPDLDGATPVEPAPDTLAQGVSEMEISGRSSDSVPANSHSSSCSSNSLSSGSSNTPASSIPLTKATSIPEN